mgnify:CR=1 FL=1
MAKQLLMIVDDKDYEFLKAFKEQNNYTWNEVAEYLISLLKKELKMQEVVVQ